MSSASSHVSSESDWHWAAVRRLPPSFPLSTPSDKRWVIYFLHHPLNINPTTPLQLLSSATQTITSTVERLDELNQRCAAFEDRQDDLQLECRAVATRLIAGEPPLLVKCELSSLSLENRSIMKELRLRSRRVRSAAKHVHCAQRQAIAKPWDCALQAEYSLLRAEQWEAKAVIRRLESKLWTGGVSILSPAKSVIRYRDAQRRDPNFAILINAYTQLAALYREKREVELQVSEKLLV